MSLKWMDGFDHYSATTGEDQPSAMFDGVYLTGGGYAIRKTGLDGIPARTGNYCLRVASNGSLRRAVGGNYRIVGKGAGVYLPGLPGGESTIFSFRDADAEDQVNINIDTTGALVIRGGFGALLHANSSPDLVSGAYQHVEARVDCDASNGAVEVRVNGVTKINLVGVNTRAHTGATGGTGRISQTWLCGNTCVFDDAFVWAIDGFTGETVTDFVGDKRVFMTNPNADTAVADLIPNSTAIGFDAIDDQAPDNAGSYLEATNPPAGSPGDVRSEFEMTDLPNNIGAITAVQTYTRMQKSEAGTCNMRASLISNSQASDGADNPLTTAWTYYQDVHALNPDTGAPWTKAEVDAMLLRIARTA